MQGHRGSCPCSSGRHLATYQGANELRSVLREFFPTFLATFVSRFALGIASPDARAVLAIAPTPAAADKLSVTRIAAALRRAGRSRNIEQAAVSIKLDLRKPQLRQPVLVEVAMGVQVLALLAALDTACASVEDLGRAAAQSFQQLPDYAIITSFPGLADSTGARVLPRSETNAYDSPTLGH